MTGDSTQLQSEFRMEGDHFAGDCSPPKFSCLQDIATGKPLHLRFASLAPQNGVAFGPAFVYDKDVGESWRTREDLDAVVSTNESWCAAIYFKVIHTDTTPPNRAGGFPMVQLLLAWSGHEGTHNIRPEQLD